MGGFGGVLYTVQGNYLTLGKDETFDNVNGKPMAQDMKVKLASLSSIDL